MRNLAHPLRVAIRGGAQPIYEGVRNWAWLMEGVHNFDQNEGVRNIAHPLRVAIRGGAQPRYEGVRNWAWLMEGVRNFDQNEC